MMPGKFEYPIHTFLGMAAGTGLFKQYAHPSIYIRIGRTFAIEKIIIIFFCKI